MTNKHPQLILFYSISIYLTLRQLETGKVDSAFIALSTKCRVFGLFSEQHYNIDNNENAYERQEILQCMKRQNSNEASNKQTTFDSLFQRLVSRETDATKVNAKYLKSISSS